MAEERDKDRSEQPSRADAVRQAVERAFNAPDVRLPERAAELAEELAGAATRFREVLEDLRPSSADELAQLREQVAALERRVAELEAARARPAAKRAAPKKPKGA